MFRESSCSSSGIANKSHGLCFCACSPCPRKVFDFRVCLPQAQENMACPCWLGMQDAHPHWVVASGGCIGQECLRLYIYVNFLLPTVATHIILRLLKLKSTGKIVACTVFLAVPAALQAAFRVKQCYLGLPPTTSCSRCYAVSVQAALCRQAQLTTQRS